MDRFVCVVCRKEWSECHICAESAIGAVCVRCYVRQVASYARENRFVPGMLGEAAKHWYSPDELADAYINQEQF